MQREVLFIFFLPVSSLLWHITAPYDIAQFYPLSGPHLLDPILHCVVFLSALGTEQQRHALCGYNGQIVPHIVTLSILLRYVYFVPKCGIWCACVVQMFHFYERKNVAYIWYDCCRRKRRDDDNYERINEADMCAEHTDDRRLERLSSSVFSKQVSPLCSFVIFAISLRYS